MVIEMTQRIIKTICKCCIISAHTTVIAIRCRKHTIKSHKGFPACNQPNTLSCRLPPQDFIPQRLLQSSGSPCIDGQRRMRRIVRVLHTGRTRRGICSEQGRIDANIHMGQLRCNHLKRNRPRTQNCNTIILCAVDDGGFHAPYRWPAIEDERNASCKIVIDHGCRRRAWPSREICRRCRDGNTSHTDECTGNITVRTAYAYTRKAPRNNIRDLYTLWQNDGEWSRCKCSE